MHEIEEKREKAVLVGIDWPDAPWPVRSSLEELSRLADTAGADTVATTVQRRSKPEPRTLVGSGKVAEIKELCTSYDADLVIFDDELSPSQQSNLEKAFGSGVKVIDRTALILDIFALHATTREGRLQVQLAQSEYLYPRLRGMWANLMTGHMGGGVGSRFGGGENQLELDRRNVRNKITELKRELAQLERIRATQREARATSGVFKVCLAGYTNAGKSSLLNRLTDADVLSFDKLFATLDSTTRKLRLPEGRQITITDTVGFIRKLPTSLVESFKSTLDEVRGADLILHVCDASSEELAYQRDTVVDVLAQIGAQDIPRLDVLNKCDLLSDEMLSQLKEAFPDAVPVSAFTGEGIDALLEHITHAAASSDERFDLVVPYTRGDVVSLAHEQCRILLEEHTEEGTHLVVDVPAALAHHFHELDPDWPIKEFWEL